MTRTTFLFLFAFSLAACGGSGGSDSNEGNLQFTTLPAARDAVGAVPRGTYVIRSQQELGALIASNSTGFLMGDAGRFPPVDYGRDSVVGVLSGLGNSCLGHEIVAVSRSGAVVTVQHRRVEPIPGSGRVCGPEVVPTSVWASVARTDATVRFEELAVRNY